MLRKIALASLLALLPVAAAHAQVVSAAGPRIGFSSSPEQLVIGGQLVVSGFAPDWTFDPSLEFGVGSNLTVIAFNADVNYHFRISDSDWSPHLGGGIGVNSISVDNPAPRRDFTNTEVGVNLIVGVSVPTQAGNRWFAEIRFGLGDIPDLKLMGGVNFKL